MYVFIRINTKVGLNFKPISDDRKKLDGFSLFGTESPEDIENLAGLSEVMNRMTIQSQPKYNVRNSLAWDSAFFASPGSFYLPECFGFDKSFSVLSCFIFIIIFLCFLLDRCSGTGGAVSECQFPDRGQCS